MFWKRSATLQIGSRRYDMSNLYFEFDVPFKDSDTLGTASITVHNLAEATRKEIEKGTPVMRPLFYDFSGDEKAWEIRDEYMFGPDGLVAPVLGAGGTHRSVYLPAGAQWTDLHNGKTYEGGQTLPCAAPLERIPVFLKNGSHPDWIGKL